MSYNAGNWHVLITTLISDTPIAAAIHESCNILGYKNKEVLSTDDIVNAIIDSW